MVIHGIAQVNRLVQVRTSSRASVAKIGMDSEDLGHPSSTFTQMESEVLESCNMALAEMLELKPQAGWVRRYFTTPEVARSFLRVASVANQSAWPTVGPTEHSQESATSRPIFAIVVLTGAHACLFDNFVSHLVRLQPLATGSLVFPPLAVFPLDWEAFGWCKQIIENDEVHTSKIFALCVSPANNTKELHKSDQPQVVFGDAAYRTAVWMKPMLLSMALTVGDYSVLVTDVDIVYLRPPLVLNAARFRTLAAPMPASSLRGSIDKHVHIEVACEVDGNLATANTGLIFSWAGSLPAIDQWSTVLRMPPVMDDQAAFRRKVSASVDLAESVACLPRDNFKLRCSCGGQQCDDQVIAVHCTEVPNKTASLEASSLWAAKYTNPSQCRYGVGPAWWKSHPKAAAAARFAVNTA